MEFVSAVFFDYGYGSLDFVDMNTGEFFFLNHGASHVSSLVFVDMNTGEGMNYLSGVICARV